MVWRYWLAFKVGYKSTEPFKTCHQGCRHKHNSMKLTTVLVHAT